MSKAQKPRRPASTGASAPASSSASSAPASSSAPVSACASPAPEQYWGQVCERMEVKLDEKLPSDKPKVEPKKSHEWKTIRIFISSTFTDFWHEREILIKQVFQDLRIWCQERRLKLIDIDLRWGVADETPSDETLKICLGEIDRCEEENEMPYFINLTSARSGWVPEEDFLKRVLADYATKAPERLKRYIGSLITGLSVTEMEIVHGAYHNRNPNALFLIRELDGKIRKELKGEEKNFYARNEDENKKLAELKSRIRQRFEDKQIITYEAEYDKRDPEENKHRFVFKPEDTFAKVLQFFKDRIEYQYPLEDTPSDPLEAQRRDHETFVKFKARAFIGRTELREKIQLYINDKTGKEKPLVLVGEAGAGKSAMMARAAVETIERAESDEIPGIEGVKDVKWTTFYHFVGAVPLSTDLHAMLKRLLVECFAVQEDNIPTKLDDAVNMTRGILKYPTVNPTIIFVDALNQFDESGHLLRWLPATLSPNVRCIVSVIKSSELCKKLISRKPQQLTMGPLSDREIKDLAQKYLGEYGKELVDGEKIKKKLEDEKDEMKLLLAKKSARNPLWLITALEELRVYGIFRVSDPNNPDAKILKIPKKIKDFPDSLEGLLGQVLDRFIADCKDEGPLLEATLCLLEVSKAGLQETELLEILPRARESTTASSKATGRDSKERLPALEWVRINRTLRPFLRPFGAMGEGRLDFYHRSISKEVRRKFLESGSTKWQRILADYFQGCSDYDRKVEEYPVHLTRLNDTARLREFLEDWEVFDRLFDSTNSTTLFSYWKQVCGDKSMEELKKCYYDQLKAFETDGKTDGKDLSKKYLQLAWLNLQITTDVKEDLQVPEELAQRALRLEKTLGDRPETLAESYSVLAGVSDKRIKFWPKICVEMKPDQTECMQHNMSAIKHLQNIPSSHGQHVQTKLGTRHLKLAFALGMLDQIGGYDAKAPSGKTCFKEAEDNIHKAEAIFKKFSDNGKLAEALEKESILHWRDNEKQLKLYEEAFNKSEQTYSRYHVLSARILYNWAITLRKLKKSKEAYEKFSECYRISALIYGPMEQPARRMVAEDDFKTFHNMKKLEETVKRNRKEMNME